MAFLDQLFCMYRRWRLLATIAFSITAFGFGFFALAPFLGTPVFSALSTQVAANPVLSSFLDVEMILFDNFVAAMVPMAVIWSCGLAAYYWQRDHVETLNRVLGYFSVLTAVPGKFLFYLFAASAGVGSYAYTYGRTDLGLAILMLAGMRLGLPGLLLIATSTPQFKRRQFLDDYALHGAVLFGFLAGAGLMYGVISKYVRVWLVIQPALVGN